MTAPDGPRAVLLDTCALIWFAHGAPMSPQALEAMSRAGAADGVFVSPVSAWEVGLLCRPGRAGRVQFLPDAKTWFARVLAQPMVRLAPFTPEIAIDSSHLPEPVHGDPGDRLLIATARHVRMPIVTREGPIQAYAAAGHVTVIRC